jgi:hypothetical protein
VFIGQVIRGELHQSHTRLELRILTRGPVDTDIELNATVLDTVVNFNVGVVGLLQNGDLALGAMVESLMNEVQNSYLVLFDLWVKGSAPFAKKRTRGICFQVCHAPAIVVTAWKEMGDGEEKELFIPG